MNITLHKNMKKISSKHGGYTLLFAVLVSSLVLAVGISILTINKKELLLTAGARDSSAAFYAADGARECAVQADLPVAEGDAFSTETNNAAHLGQSTCPNGIFSTNYPDFNSDLDPFIADVIFKFDVQFKPETTNGPCASVTVTKGYRNGQPRTYILSKGYNLGWNIATKTCSVPGARRVERAIEYSY
jgi:hypothetical protein